MPRLCTCPLLQAQSHAFNMPLQLAHPDHVPETDMPDDAQVFLCPYLLTRVESCLLVPTPAPMTTLVVVCTL